MNIRFVKLKTSKVLAELVDVEPTDLPAVNSLVYIDGSMFTVCSIEMRYEKAEKFLDTFGIETPDTWNCIHVVYL